MTLPLGIEMVLYYMHHQLEHTCDFADLLWEHMHLEPYGCTHARSGPLHKLYLDLARYVLVHSLVQLYTHTLIHEYEYEYSRTAKHCPHRPNTAPAADCSHISLSAGGRVWSNPAPTNSSTAGGSLLTQTLPPQQISVTGQPFSSQGAAF
jgi:hypothetical protein